MENCKKCGKPLSPDWILCPYCGARPAAKIDACPRGKRTKEDMRTVAGLLNKFAMDQDIIPRNYAANLYTGRDRKGTRPAFTWDEVDAIRQAVGTLPYADYVYTLIYTGFRPSELFALTKDSYNAQDNTLTGGAKTEAGRDRVVPVYSGLLPILQRRLESPSRWLFPRADGTQMNERYFRSACFNPLMDQLGITDRLPYSCRHTFANLLKQVRGSDTDKAAIIGHADASMTKYYQSADLASLRSIIDQFPLPQK